jgi:hypothetical protein
MKKMICKKKHSRLDLSNHFLKSLVHTWQVYGYIWIGIVPSAVQLTAELKHSSISKRPTTPWTRYVPTWPTCRSRIALVSTHIVYGTSTINALFAAFINTSAYWVTSLTSLRNITVRTSGTYCTVFATIRRTKDGRTTSCFTFFARSIVRITILRTYITC